MPAENLFQRGGDFADRGLGAGGIDGERQQVAVAVARRARQRAQRLGNSLRVALALEPAELVDLQVAHGGIVDLQDIDRRLVDRRDIG